MNAPTIVPGLYWSREADVAVEVDQLVSGEDAKKVL